MSKHETRFASFALALTCTGFLVSCAEAAKPRAGASCECETWSCAEEEQPKKTDWSANRDERFDPPPCAPDPRRGALHEQWVAAALRSWDKVPHRKLVVDLAAETDGDGLAEDVGAEGWAQTSTRYHLRFKDTERAIKGLKSLVCDPRVIGVDFSGDHFPEPDASSSPDAPPCPGDRWRGTWTQLEWDAVTRMRWEGTPNGRALAGLLPYERPLEIAEAIGAVDVRGPLFYGVYEFAFEDADAAVRGFKLLLCHDAVTRANLELVR